MQNIEKSLEDYSKKGKKFDMFKLMGIDGNLTKEQKENISNASKQIADDIGQMADFVVEQYQRQIALFTSSSEPPFAIKSFSLFTAYFL